MRNLIFTLACLGIIGSASAQTTGVGVGGTPDASAALDINSTNRGLLLPRVGLQSSSDNTTIASPATGLLVYNTTTNIGGVAGLAINIGTTTSPSWQPLPTGLNWTLAGNAATASSFLGTTNSQPLIFKTNSNEVGRFLTNGNVWMGTGYSYNSGSYNLAIGYQVADQATSTTLTGSYNTFLGYQAGYQNKGNSNVFIGPSAGYNNTTPDNNMFIGREAGYTNTTQNFNTFIGTRSGYRNGDGNYNLFMGPYSGQNNTTGGSNVFLGPQAGGGNTTGGGNVFVGAGVGGANNTGGNNLFIGASPGANNTSGSYNTFSGFQAGYRNTIGSYNVFSGITAGYSNTEGNNNAFMGTGAGTNTTTGSYNLALGYDAGRTNTTGSYNTFLGYESGLVNQQVQHTNAMAIGQQAKVDGDNTLALGGTGQYAVKVGIGVAAPTEVLQVAGNILASGTITQNSDRRLKTNIRPLGSTLANVAQMRGVRYEFIPGKGPAGEQVGVIAQEVEKFYPELVRTDNVTGIKSVNYAQLTPVLLEAIKELRLQLAASQGTTEGLVKQQQQTTASIEELSTRLRALEAGTTTQASR